MLTGFTTNYGMYLILIASQSLFYIFLVLHFFHSAIQKLNINVYFFLYIHLTVCYYHVTCAFRSESTLYICRKVKELLARNRRDIWRLSDCNGTRTHNYLVPKRTLNHLAKVIKWLSYVVSTYLYGAFHCKLLSCHVRISEWIHTLY